MSASPALLLGATPEQGRAGAIRAWASIGGIATGLGPVLGGAPVEADRRRVLLVDSW